MGEYSGIQRRPAGPPQTGGAADGGHRDCRSRWLARPVYRVRRGHQRLGTSAAACGGSGWTAGPRTWGIPALVNLVTTGCQLDGAAFAATILQLGARRVLALSEPEPGGNCGACRPARQPATWTWPAYERLVLDDVTRQFAEAGSAPFEALADLCFADVKGVWDPFEEAVRAAGRQRGLTRARLPKTALAVLYTGGTGRCRARRGGRGRRQLDPVGRRGLRRAGRAGRAPVAHRKAGPQRQADRGRRRAGRVGGPGDGGAGPAAGSPSRAGSRSASPPTAPRRFPGWSTSGAATCGRAGAAAP